jgi:glycosyltransferase involved in cell wall biosynthesis
MGEEMKLSIILPSLREDNLSKCLKSIYSGSHTDYEIIVVGKFEPLFLLGGWWNQQDLDIKFIEDDKCIGTTYAIQKGLEESSGEYVVALSDDALVCPHWDDYMIEFLESFPKDKIVVGNFRVYNKNGEANKIGYYGRQFSMFPIMRKSDIEKLGCYYSTEFNAFYSDPDLGIRVAEANGIIATYNSSFIYHPYNPDQLHLDNKSKYWQHDEDVFKKKWSHLGEFKGCEVIK